MNKPRIGLFTRPIDQGTSGSGHHSLEMLKYILKIDHGYDITCVHYMKGTDPVYEGLKEFIIPRNPLKASRMLEAEGFDLLHYTPVSAFAPVWGVSARKTATIHNAEAALIPRYFSPVAVVHEYTAAPINARKMEKIITVSEAAKEFLSKLYKVPEERFEICYNGYNHEYRVLKPEEIRAPAKYGVKGDYLLHISRYSPRKNPWTLLKAFARLSKKRPDLTLVIAGSRWDNEKVLAFLKKNNLEKRVVLTGFAPEEDIIQLLNGAKLFLFPSLCEGFGMPNVEAMACGCPVITSNEFAIPEVVGDAAILTEKTLDDAELAEKTEKLLDDPYRAEHLRRNGFERIKRFSWEESAKKMVGVWDGVLQ